MFSTLLTATLFTAFAIRGALAQGFTLYTVPVNQCGSAEITWTEATGPYNLAVVPVDDPCNNILVDLGDHDGLSATWENVTVPAGTKIFLSLLDSSDQEAWSAEITIGDGDSACLTSASSDETDTNVATISGSPTTLTLTSSFSRSASSESETATIVGAANAGSLGNAPSGAVSNVRLPAAATVLASVAAIAAALAL